MDSKTAINIYKWVAYVLLAGATAVYFLTKKADMTLMVLTLAVFVYALMFRTRAQALENENNELTEDLRKLTLALAKAEHRGKEGSTTEEKKDMRDE